MRVEGRGFRGGMALGFVGKVGEVGRGGRGNGRECTWLIVTIQ